MEGCAHTYHWIGSIHIEVHMRNGRIHWICIIAAHIEQTLSEVGATVVQQVEHIQVCWGQGWWQGQRLWRERQLLVLLLRRWTRLSLDLLLLSTSADQTSDLLFHVLWGHTRVIPRTVRLGCHRLRCRRLTTVATEGLIKVELIARLGVRLNRLVVRRRKGRLRWKSGRIDSHWRRYRTDAHPLRRPSHRLLLSDKLLAKLFRVWRAPGVSRLRGRRLTHSARRKPLAGIRIRRSVTLNSNQMFNKRLSS